MTRSRSITGPPKRRWRLCLPPVRETRRPPGVLLASSWAGPLLSPSHACSLHYAPSVISVAGAPSCDYPSLKRYDPAVAMGYGQNQGASPGRPGVFSSRLFRRLLEHL